MSSMEPWYAATIALSQAALRGLQVTTRVAGEQHLPRTGPVILACAHISYPDFLFVGKAGLARGRRIRFMSRHDVWNVPLVARAMTRMQHIPVDRTAPAGAYLTARGLLEQGEAVCAFPEAGISYSYTVRPMMRGVAALARETGAPVLPVVVWGSQRLYSLGRPVNGHSRRLDLTRGRLVDVRFGEPFGVPPEANLVDTTRMLGHTLTEMLESVQVLPEHRPGAADYAPWYPSHLGGHAPDRTEAQRYDEPPASAVLPTWGPGTTAYREPHA